MVTRAKKKARHGVGGRILTPRGAGVDSTILVPDTGTKRIDADVLTVSAQTVYRPRDRIAGAGPLELLDVKGALPANTDFGAVVVAHEDNFGATVKPKAASVWDVSDRVARVLGVVKGITDPVAVTGPLTDAQLRAAAVPVSGAFFQATQPVSLAAAIDVSDRIARLLGQVVGTVAHDGVDSGNPIKLGGRARSALITAVAQDDRVDAIFDLFGRQQVVLCRTKILGQHKAESGRLTVLAAAHAATAGFFWLINPVGSGVTCVLKKLMAMAVPTAITAFPSAPRVTAERVTFTGTASGAQLTAAKRDSTDANAVCTLRTASTGLTLTGGAVITSFFVPPVLTGVGVAVPAEQYLYDSTDEDDYLVLRPGEGIVFRQADAGTASDTRVIVISLSWEER